MASLFFFLSAVMCLTIGGWARVTAAEVVPTIGERFEGVLTGLTAEGVATYRTSAGDRAVRLSDLVRWGTLAEADRGLLVLLPEEGAIVAEEARTEGEKLTFESDLLGRLTLPLESLAGLVFRPPADAQDRDRLIGRVRSRQARQDRLLLENGDELAGSVVAVGPQAVEFETAGRKVTVERARIAAAALDPTLATTRKGTAARVRVGLVDGSRLLAASLIIENDQARLSLVEGSTWNVPAEAIVFLQPLQGKVKYLSDLAAEGYRHLPYLSGQWPYERDANVLGTQLRAQGRVYAKGLGMHSAARLTYRLDNHYRTFAADVALDDHVGRGGAVQCAVYVDEKAVWKSDVLRGGDPPVPVSVDITGGKRLSLLVEFAERGDELDRVNWLDARVLSVE